MKRTSIALLTTLLCFNLTATLPAQVPVQDSLALVALYNATDGPNWTDNTNWLSGPVGTWYGVALLGGLVNSLSLPGNGLNGPLPSEIGDLTAPIALRMNGNNLTGPIPPEIGNLTTLRTLNLGVNSLSGTLPVELGQLSDMLELSLPFNQFTGTIPQVIGDLTNLTGLDLRSNGFSGGIPPELGQLSNVRLLDLRNNDLTGTIPPELGDLALVEHFRLSGNQLTGSLPVELSNLTQVRGFEVAFNQLSGAIPAWLGSLPNLNGLTLWSNQFSGGIPVELAHPTNLQVLDLRTNNLSGPIPPELGDMPAIVHLRLGRNNLSGSIPPELGNLSTLCGGIDLSSNQLSGPIPPELGDITCINAIELNSNQLTGAVPASFTGLTSLLSLRIHTNELDELPSLAHLPLFTLLVGRNNFTFEDLEPNVGVPGIQYTPQEPLFGMASTQNAAFGATTVLEMPMGGASNVYQWRKDGVPIVGATNDSYTIPVVDFPDAGDYTVVVTNTAVPGLTFTSRPITLVVTEAVTITADSSSVAVSEGSTASNSGSMEVAGGSTPSFSASLGSITALDDTSWTWSYYTTDGPSESTAVTITVDDQNGGSAEVSFDLTVNNVSPAISQVSVPIDPVDISDQPITVSADFSDPAGSADAPYACSIDYGDGGGASPGSISAMTCSASDHAYDGSGIYTVTVTITDKDGGSGIAEASSYVVVYDPEGGFVTGGGWIDSPAEACPSICGGASGKANFGFVSKYKQGQSTPSGETEFNFKAGDLNFHSASYDWLVVAGPQAKFKGNGTINGEGDYGFMLSAVDGKLTGGGGKDKFRIKIWDASEAVVYDNQLGDDDDADTSDEIEGGSIVIHTGNGPAGKRPDQESDVPLPETYALHGNYPNPFNPSTTIAFDLPVSGHVRLQVFDLLGRLIATLLNADVKAGVHAVAFDATALPSGTYLYRLQAGSYAESRTMLLMK